MNNWQVALCRGGHRNNGQCLSLLPKPIFHGGKATYLQDWISQLPSWAVGAYTPRVQVVRARAVRAGGPPDTPGGRLCLINPQLVNDSPGLSWFTNSLNTPLGQPGDWHDYDPEKEVERVNVSDEKLNQPAREWGGRSGESVQGKIKGRYEWSINVEAVQPMPTHHTLMHVSLLISCTRYPSPFRQFHGPPLRSGN